MPGLPDKNHMKLVEDECLRLFDEGKKLGALQLADELMKLPELPMHSPYTHFLVPAALLTAAHMFAESSRDELVRDLAKAAERSKDIPGGICGLNGCCGAGIGAGIFASIWQKTSPTSKSGWAACNAMTADSLAAIAGVEGPRCCKRVTYLSITAAMSSAKERLGVDLGELGDVKCSHHYKSRDCRGFACPYFPGV